MQPNRDPTPPASRIADCVIALPTERPMMTLDRQGFMALREVLPAATKACLRETFGVSETTWVKLRDGRPVKPITLERLLVRYRAIVAANEHARA